MRFSSFFLYSFLPVIKLYSGRRTFSPSNNFNKCLLNKSKSLDKKITFIYAIRDDLFKDKDKKTNMILIGTDCRVLDKNKNKDELFEYDWLNEDDDEYKQKQSDDLEM